MQNYTFKLSLRIWHPTIDPEEISKNLAISPNRSWKVGSQGQTPKGTVLKGKYTESYWNADPFEHGKYSSSNSKAEDIINKLVQKLDCQKEFLHLLRQQGAKIIIQVSSFGEGNYAIDLSPNTLKKITELNVGFAHDVYSCEQH